jgi:hypothetical protein
MQAEAGIAELIYLVCVFNMVTDLVFNHSGRVYEAVVFKLYQFIGQQRKIRTVLERDSGFRQSPGYRVKYSQILDDTIRAGLKRRECKFTCLHRYHSSY